MRRGVLILGAGAAGLGAGLALHELGSRFEIVEQDDAPGGLARTDLVDGFSFERTGHVLHFKLPHVEQRFRSLGVQLERIERRAGILLGDREIPYPFQYNLWALESRRLARSVVEDMRRAAANGEASRSFSELLLSQWGARGTSLFFRPYNEKLWGRPLDELPADCAGRFLPKPDVALAEKGSEHHVHLSGYNGTFLYPASGQLGDTIAALARPIRDRLRCRTKVTAIDLERRQLRTADGATISYERLISTIPLGRLAEMSGLRTGDPGLFGATRILNIRVGLRGSLRTPYHWVYVADTELPFHRIGFPQNVNQRTCPNGCTSLSIEYTIPRRGRRLSSAAVASAAVDYLVRRGLLEVDEKLFHDELLISPAYVVQRAPGRIAFTRLERTLREHGVRLAGRFGTWDYLSIEESFESGTRAARACAGAEA
jgi:protoporphyrinogen oxidase